MSSKNRNGFLTKHGLDLIEAGYHIVPIKQGDKRPPFTGWEKIRADRSLLREWLEDGYGSCGVGIITGRVIALDLDVQDETIAKELEDWAMANIGMAPVRVGQAPKRLLVYRTDAPFPKITSKSFDNPALPDNEKGKRTKNRVEILADGQQFVSHAIHPGTGKPYEWLYGEDLPDVRFDDLPLITKEHAEQIAKFYEQLAREAGWAEIKGSALITRMDSPVGEIDYDDPFAADVQTADISDDELHRKLLLVPGFDDYDVWLQIGMALFHQYQGGERGLELWHEWSEQADNYDADALDDKWETFDISDKGRAPVTARLIIKLAKENAERLATEVSAELNKALSAAQNMAELKAAAERIKKTELDTPTREQMTGLLRDRFKVLTNQSLSIRAARDMLRYENQASRDLPRWLEGCTYVAGEDKFFNLKNKSLTTQTAFNAANSRFMLTKQDVLEGRARPERLPSDVALNIHQVPVLDGIRYMPGEDDMFTMNGLRYANEYTDRNIPDVPDTISKLDRRNIELVKSHFTHLFPDEREARVFLDYIAYVVQNPGKRPGWAVLVQGTEGDGKTFFGVLLGAVLGAENVRMLNAKTVQGDFNGWAEGQQVVFVEEIRLHGHNRFDILNQIKPLITNDVIEIHRKGRDPYNVPNTSSYILATNYRDALPLTEDDSRYFVMFSRFQTKAALDAFKAQNPDYYGDLYDAINESAGALRGWLLNHEFGQDFTVGNRAPASRAKGYMAMLAKSEEQQAIEAALAGSMRFDLCRELVNTTTLVDEMVASDVEEIPRTKKLGSILSAMGFTFLGQHWYEGRPRSFWSQTPDRFTANGKVQPALIREWLSCDL